MSSGHGPLNAQKHGVSFWLSLCVSRGKSSSPQGHRGSRWGQKVPHTKVREKKQNSFSRVGGDCSMTLLYPSPVSLLLPLPSKLGCFYMKYLHQVFLAVKIRERATGGVSNCQPKASAGHMGPGRPTPAPPATRGSTSFRWRLASSTRPPLHALLPSPKERRLVPHAS